MFKIFYEYNKLGILMTATWLAAGGITVKNRKGLCTT